MARRSIYFMLALLFQPGCGVAASVAGVDLPDEVRISGFESPLLLNGAGVRKKYFISVYVGALYLAERQVGVGTLLTVPTANRVSMHFVYSKVNKRQLAEAWREGVAENLPAGALAAVEQRLERFVALFPDMHEGDTIWLDFVPGRGTQVSINGTPQGTIEGDDFNSALLSVWLGEKPVTAALKNAMVGVDKN